MQTVTSADYYHRKYNLKCDVHYKCAASVYCTESISEYRKYRSQKYTRRYSVLSNRHVHHKSQEAKHPFAAQCFFESEKSGTEHTDNRQPLTFIIA